MLTWFTIDCGLPDHPKMAALPNDSARYGWIVAIAKAKRQPHPGTFASVRHWREVMGRFARYSKPYLDARLLELAADGSLVVHDWAGYQRDPAGRQSLHRHSDVTPESQESHDSVTDMSLRAGAVPVPLSL